MKKTSLLIMAFIILSLLLTACKNNEEKKIADVVRTFYETMKKGDLDKALTLTKGTDQASPEQLLTAKDILSLGSSMAKGIDKVVVKQVKLLDEKNALVLVELQLGGKAKDTKMKAFKEASGWKVDISGQ
ncbi:MAG: hypothetical protein ACOY3J_07830 [Bacillota bacterium]|uniref:DUF4878 domain-containing protein n=1 Tax=Thermanaerosceptrum fracticalcis TaxID=1712410 RepID=A0A7G6DZF5_THEFR|nr:hypothetical protein [Thermanaerosceptrum fracticalcis]QNB45209.1 hypothetical protein BR63_02060 [Thermanaerosceptrum fracticalcis]